MISRSTLRRFAADPAPLDSDVQRGLDRGHARFIGALVAVATGVEAHAILAPKRATEEAARARQIAMYLTHIVYSWSMSRVGAAFDRDRTTASYACHRVEDLRDDAHFDAVILKLERCARAAPMFPELRGL